MSESVTRRQIVQSALLAMACYGFAAQFSRRALAWADRGVRHGWRPRGDWTDTPVLEDRADSMRRFGRLTVHHSGIDISSADEEVCIDMLRQIQRSHIRNGWADIGYHLMIDPAGRVWEGRPLMLQGAHVANQNLGNIGVVVLGHFEASEPTDAAMAALMQSLVVLQHRFLIKVDEIWTHRELQPTVCPGQNLQRRMDALRAPDGLLAQI